MGFNVLVVNCGSSSIKYQVIDMESKQELASGLMDRVGIPGTVLTHKPDGKDKVVIEKDMPDHTAGMQLVLETLTDANYGVIKDLADIKAVGHRVVHGGEAFSESVIIDDAVKQVIRDCFDIAPLHNPPNLMGIEACETLMPNVPHVAVFDTAFHQTMPPVAFRYPLPKAFYDEHKIRRYGFHGTSHAYVSERASEITSAKGPHGWLTAHLGNGCSATAVYDGKSLDTSMGLTPLEGLMMGTRSGDVDPSLHIHLKRQLGMSLEEIDKVLNNESGLLGISGLSNDLRTIEQAANEGHQDAKLAIEMFCYRVAKYLASLSCALPNFTGLVFTGGIGENSVTTRTRILEMMPHFGIKVDADKNASLVGGREGSFQADDSSIELWVVPTDEECRIAQETRQALGLQ